MRDAAGGAVAWGAGVWGAGDWAAAGEPSRAATSTTHRHPAPTARCHIATSLVGTSGPSQGLEKKRGMGRGPCPVMTARTLELVPHAGREKIRVLGVHPTVEVAIDPDEAAVQGRTREQMRVDRIEREARSEPVGDSRAHLDAHKPLVTEWRFETRVVGSLRRPSRGAPDCKATSGRTGEDPVPRAARVVCDSGAEREAAGRVDVDLGVRPVGTDLEVRVEGRRHRVRRLGANGPAPIPADADARATVEAVTREVVDRARRQDLVPGAREPAV